MTHLARDSDTGHFKHIPYPPYPPVLPTCTPKISDCRSDDAQKPPVIELLSRYGVRAETLQRLSIAYHRSRCHFPVDHPSSPRFG
jgi:hypothetical protein